MTRPSATEPLQAARYAGTRFQARILTTGLVVVVATLQCPPTSEAQQYQWGAVHQHYSFPEPAWNVDTNMWPAVVSEGNFFAQQFYLENGGLAYMGLQQGVVGDQVARFSVWDATEARASTDTGSSCRDFGGEGVGKTCTIPYDFRTGHWYRLRLWLLESDADGHWWGAYVSDDEGNEKHIGLIRAPAGKGLVLDATSFNEYWGTARGFPCGRLPPSAVYIYQPILNYGASRAELGRTNTLQCSAGRVTSSWNHTMSKLELRHARVSGSAPSKSPPDVPGYRRHPPARYTTFAGTMETLNVYEGERVVFYSPDDLSYNGYSGVLEHLDSCMDMYIAFAATPYPQRSPPDFPGKGSVAAVKNTCVGGAACGSGGRAEAIKELLDDDISLAGGDLSNPLGWPLAYYEMGRGSWFPFYNALPDSWNPGGNTEYHEIASGFPFFMVGACRHEAGVSYDTQEEHFERLKRNYPPSIFNTAYESLGLSFVQVMIRDNPELLPVPTSAPPSNGRPRGINHVYAMILTDLYRQYGRSYLQWYLEELSRMTADSVMEMEQNLLDAAMYAFFRSLGAGVFAVRRLQDVWRLNHDWRPRSSSHLGGLDLQGTCRAWYGDQAYVILTSAERSPHAAFAWRCVTGDGSQVGIDMQRACRDAHGRNAFGFPVDLDYAYSWGCYLKSYGRVSAVDLVVSTPTVSANALAANQRFTFSATIHNIGTTRAAGTTLEVYRSGDSVISWSDDRVAGTSESSLSLDAGAARSERFSINAPVEPGVYYYGACATTISSDFNADNNCSVGVEVTVAGAVDLVVDQLAITDDTLTPGQFFAVSARVRNRGTGSAPETRIGLYRSGDPTISTADELEHGEPLMGLSANAEITYAPGTNAPSIPGRYYYGVCVDAVAGETLTDNNCSTGVPVTVDGIGFTDDPVVAGVTPVKAIHFSELRNVVDARRVEHGLQRFPWTDATLAAGVTRVKGVHVSELRSALRQVYDAAGQTVGFNTEVVRSGGEIRAWHINELRRAVVALEGTPGREEYQITLTDVRIDRIERSSSSEWEAMVGPGDRQKYGNTLIHGADTVGGILQQRRRSYQWRRAGSLRQFFGMESWRGTHRSRIWERSSFRRTASNSILRCRAWRGQGRLCWLRKEVDGRSRRLHGHPRRGDRGPMKGSIRQAGNRFGCGPHQVIVARALSALSEVLDDIRLSRPETCTGERSPFVAERPVEEMDALQDHSPFPEDLTRPRRRAAIPTGLSRKSNARPSADWSDSLRAEHAR